MEPERPIEKLLRAWANKRRRDEEPPLELHPATRRLLQGEVERKFRANQRQARTFTAWFAAVWPRFALALGVFAVLGTVVWLSMPPLRERNDRGLLVKGEPHGFSKEEIPPQASRSARPAEMFDQRGVRTEPLADNTKKEFAEGQLQSKEVQGGNRTDATALAASDGLAEDRRKAARLSSSPAPSPEPSLVGPGRTSASGTTGTPAPMVAAGAAPSAPPSGPPSESRLRTYGLGGPPTTTQAPITSLAPVPSAGPTVAGADLSLQKDGLMKQSTDETDKSATLNKPLAAAAPSTAVSPPQSFFFANDAKLQTVTNGERFARVDFQTKAKALAGDKTAPAKAVLASFEVERIGSEVRVVDADGSIYTGYVQSPGEIAASRSVTERKSAASAATLRSRGATLEHEALADAQVQLGRDFTFRVAGTNRTLRENVVFIGQLFGAPGAAVPSVTTNSLEVVGYARKVASDAAKPAGNVATNASRISGKASVGKRAEVEINAVSAGK